MYWPPFWGGTTGFDQPDPIIWWIVAPPLSYAWAVWVAWGIAGWMEMFRTWKTQRREGD